MYDSSEIKKRVNDKRRKFLCFFIGLISLFLALLVLICLHLNDTVTVACIFGEGLTLMFIYVLFSKSEPSVIFSAEIKGRSIKEEEYVASLPVGSSLGYRQTGSRGVPQPFAPNTRANKRRTPPNVRGEVYIRQENGSITLVRGLSPAHLELYEDEDLLQKYAGTRYPIILSRAPMRQPCPICGEINDITQEACHGCGLTITKDEK